MPKARIKLPPELDGSLRSDLERLIQEANLGRDDTIIATRYIIEQIPQIEIAVEFDLERSTISQRLKRIISRLIKTAKKME